MKAKLGEKDVVLVAIGLTEASTIRVEKINKLLDSASPVDLTETATAKELLKDLVILQDYSDLIIYLCGKIGKCDYSERAKQIAKENGLWVAERLKQCTEVTKEFREP